MKNDKNTHKKGIKGIGIIIILASCFVLTVLLLCENLWEPENAIIKTLMDLVLNLCITGVTIGAGTVLYSYFDFVKYIEDQLKSIVLEQDFMDELSSQKKEEIANRLEKQMLYKDNECDENTLYDFAHSEIKKLIKKPFFESMHLNVYCKAENDFIYKKITRKYTLDYSADKNYKYDLEKLTKTWFLENSDEESFTITKLIINDNDYTDKIERCITRDECEPAEKYNTKICYQFKGEGHKAPAEIYNDTKKIDVEIEYVTKVSLEDTTMGFRVYYPCKRLSIVLSYEKETIDINYDTFCFKDRPSDEESKNKIQTTVNHNCVDIVFNDWILPGDGTIFVFKLKN